MAEMLCGGEMLIRSLQAEEVEYIFGYPGGAALHIYDALFKQDKMKHILVRHEQAATHAADGYARATGKVGTALVTSGPGATNAITGIATAHMDSIPLVVISGQVPSTKIGDDAFQEADMVGIARPITKHTFLVTDPQKIPEIIKKAYYIARSGRPGPVVVDIPKDMTNPSDLFPYQPAEAVKMRSYHPIIDGHSGQIKRAVEAIMNAERPVVLVGGGAVIGRSDKQVRKFCQLLNMPVASTLMGLGAYPGTDKQHLGLLGMHGTYEANTAMHHADLILGLGVRFDDRTTNNTKKYCPNAKIVHVDIDPTSISKTIHADIPVVGDLSHVLESMLECIGTQTPSNLDNWWQKIEQWRQTHGILHKPCHEPSGGKIIKPQDVIKSLYKTTEGNAFVTSDVGQHQMFAAQYYLFDEPNRWINSGGLGTMGFGLPAAMGVALAYPDADVACVTGEGSIQMCIQELSTCTQHKLPIKIINLNNHALGMVRQWQDMIYGGRYASSLYEDSLPDFVKLAESYGHVGICVDRFEDLEAAMQECFALKDRTVFLDVQVDQTEHVYPMLVAEESMRDMFVRKGERV